MSKPMSADAYAGFLKLWLTPAHKEPAMTPEVQAYLRHASATERAAEAKPARLRTLRKAA